MLAIDKEGARADITAIKEKLGNPEKKAECIAEIKKLIDMKETHIWRVDSIAPCCGTICGFASLFEAEIGILQTALDAIEESNGDKAASLLEDYFAFLEENYENEAAATNGFRLKNP